jgi:mannose-6-phosphate isomerase-like protein (cupin superfamily)
MPDVTYKRIDEMDGIYDGVARRARAELGVTSFGMQVMSLPPNWDGYPNHDHGPRSTDSGQEEVYIPIDGDGALVAGDQEYELRPGVAIRVGPEQRRRILPGDRGIRFIALGGIPGAFDAPEWTEVGAAPPMPVPAG